MLSRDDRRQPVAEAHARSVGSNADLDDATLVAAARVNRQAFRPLYERNLDQVYRYCLLKLGSREAAEDAASEVFMRAVARLETYNGGSFAGWLFRIAQRVVADFYRQPRRGLTETLVRGQAALPLEAAEETVDPHPMPEETAIARSEHDAVLAALVELPPDQRALIELQLAGFSTLEIAAALGRSTGAVRMLRLRAFERIRPALTRAGMGRSEGASPC
jgi:RNA polymerase sigma-70 factor (ECF subfamily)